MEYTATIHHEDGSYRAEIPELPGVFASGDTVDELLEGLKEAVSMYLGTARPAPPSSPSSSSPSLRNAARLRSQWTNPRRSPNDVAPCRTPAFGSRSTRDGLVARQTRSSSKAGRRPVSLPAPPLEQVQKPEPGRSAQRDRSSATSEAPG